MSYKCSLCGEITLTPNHVCEQATQKMIDQMDKATETVQSWSKEKRETMNLSKEQEPAYDRLHNICRNVGMGFKEATELLNQLVLGTYNENNKLRAELEKLKRQWAEDDRDITALEDENNQLRAELAAERKKNDDLAFRLQDWHDSAEKAWKTPCADESHCSCVPLLRKTANDLEAQVEGLREALDVAHWAIDNKKWWNSWFKETDKTVGQLSRVDLPERAEKVRKVLEAAKEYVFRCQEEAMGPRFLEETNLFEAVREWGEK